MEKVIGSGRMVRGPPDIQLAMSFEDGAVIGGAVSIACASAKARDPGDGDDLAGGRRGCDDA